MKKTDNCSRCDIPLELWTIILTYLPVKSVLRFRSVSKPWKSIIEDLNFTSAHLKSCPNNTQNPYHIFCEETLLERNARWVFRHSETLKLDMKIESPSGDEKWEICNGIDGLILLYNKKNILLWNPSIRKVFYLPPPEIRLMEHKRHLCLLFDAVSDDYKVLMVLGGSRLIRDEYHSVHVFSLKTHSWRSIAVKYSAPGIAWISLSGDGPACNIGGSAFWDGLYSGESRGVISFDVTSNRFSFIPFPTTDFVSKKLIVLSGSVLGSLGDSGVANYFTLWTMESTSSIPDDQCPRSQRWIKRYQVYADLECYGIFCLTVQKQRDLLIIWGHGQLTNIYDPETGEFKYLLKKNKGELVYIYPYVESLLLLE